MGKIWKFINVNDLRSRLRFLCEHSTGLRTLLSQKEKGVASFYDFVGFFFPVVVTFFQRKKTKPFCSPLSYGKPCSHCYPHAHLWNSQFITYNWPGAVHSDREFIIVLRSCRHKELKISRTERRVSVQIQSSGQGPFADEQPGRLRWDISMDCINPKHRHLCLVHLCLVHRMKEGVVNYHSFPIGDEGIQASLS